MNKGWRVCAVTKEKSDAMRSTFLITYGNFPTLLLLEEGKTKYRWFFNEFGYPAKDRVESLIALKDVTNGAD